MTTHPDRDPRLVVLTGRKAETFGWMIVPTEEQPKQTLFHSKRDAVRAANKKKVASQHIVPVILFVSVETQEHCP